MDQKEKNTQVINAIEGAKKIAILPNKVGGGDAYCAGVGLYLMLKNSDKSVDIIYPGKIPEGCEDLLMPGVIMPKTNSKELLVSIDYSGSPEATAQYSATNGTLYIKVGPINDSFNTSKIKAEIKSDSYDVIFTVGAQILEDFGQTFREMERDIYRSKIINVDNTARNLSFGNINIVDASASSLSALILDISRFWGLSLIDASAKALLRGITYKKA